MSLHIPAWVFIAVAMHAILLLTVAYLILLERKVASWVQDRIGPNRVGLDFGILPFLKHVNGLGQSFADGLKFILKEEFRPAGADKTLFTVAPMVMIVVVIISIAVIPWGGIKEGIVSSSAMVPAGAQVIAQTASGVTYQYPFQIANLNIGVLFVLAVLSLAVYGVVVGGWASNNKFSFLGGLRATANMISYEIPLGLAVLSIVVMYGTLDLNQLVSQQATYWAGWIPAWNVFTQPLAFVMFLVCIHAEANRAPFDLAECEQELVGGYHTEYSSMRFALFFLAEYLGMITTSAVCVALFFGGWHFWGLNGPDPVHPEVTNSIWLCIGRTAVFYIKTLLIIFVFMWVRWSLPRFRFDQLMGLAWRALIPISLAMLMATAVVVYAWGGEQRAYLRVGGKMALALLGVNILLLLAFLILARFVPPVWDTNRRLKIEGSRFARTPLPAVS